MLSGKDGSLEDVNNIKGLTSPEQRLDVKVKLEALEAREISVIEDLYDKHFKLGMKTTHT